MEPGLFAAVDAYHRAVTAASGQRYAIETYRELLWIGTNAGDPVAGVLAAARIIGQRKSAAFALSETTNFLNDLARRMSVMGSEADQAALFALELAGVDAVVRNRTG